MVAPNTNQKSDTVPDRAQDVQSPETKPETRTPLSDAEVREHAQRYGMSEAEVRDRDANPAKYVLADYNRPGGAEWMLSRIRKLRTSLHDKNFSGGDIEQIGNDMVKMLTDDKNEDPLMKITGLMMVQMCSLMNVLGRREEIKNLERLQNLDTKKIAQNIKELNSIQQNESDIKDQLGERLKKGESFADIRASLEEERAKQSDASALENPSSVSDKIDEQLSVLQKIKREANAYAAERTQYMRETYDDVLHAMVNDPNAVAGDETLKNFLQDFLGDARFVVDDHLEIQLNLSAGEIEKRFPAGKPYTVGKALSIVHRGDILSLTVKDENGSGQARTFFLRKQGDRFVSESMAQSA